MVIPFPLVPFFHSPMMPFAKFATAGAGRAVAVPSVCALHIIVRAPANKKTVCLSIKFDSVRHWTIIIPSTSRPIHAFDQSLLVWRQISPRSRPCSKRVLIRDRISKVRAVDFLHTHEWLD